MKKIKYIAFILVLALLLAGVTTLLKASDTNTIISMKGLDDEVPNDIDVLLLGQSDAYTGYIPTEAYKEYGFSSFAYGLSAMPSSIFPAVLEHATKNQNPKVLVVEITAFAKEDKYYNKTAELHSFIDNIPWSKERYHYIKDYVDEDKQEEFFRPIATYHNNWKMPVVCGRTAFVRLMNATHHRNVLKGFSASAFKAKKKYHEKDKHFVYGKKSEEYLNRFIASCKDAGYENVLFVRFPHCKKIENQDSMDRIQQTIEDAGYDFLNLNDANKKLGISIKNDYYSSDHMNPHGAEKNTLYLGQYIMDHYSLPDHSNDAEFIKRWDGYAKDADAILEYGEKQMKKNNQVRIYEYCITMDKITKKFHK